MIKRILCALGWHLHPYVYVSYPALTSVYCAACGDLRKEIKHGYY